MSTPARQYPRVNPTAARLDADIDRLHAALAGVPRLSRTDQAAVFGRNRTAAHLGKLRQELIRRGMAIELVDNATIPATHHLAAKR